jgi:hypothetical protein
MRGAAAIVTASSCPYTVALRLSQPDATLVLSLRLMLGTSMVSGVLFTVQGAALRQVLRGAGETAGRLAVANTMGSMIGALRCTCTGRWP